MVKPIIPTVKIFISFRELGASSGINEVVDILAGLNVAYDQRFQLNFFYDRTLTYHQYDPYLSQQLFAADLIIVLNTRKYAASPYIRAHEQPWITLAANDPEKEVLVLQIGPLSEVHHWPSVLEQAKYIPYGEREVFYSNPHRKSLWSIVEADLLELLTGIAERKKTALLGRQRELLPVVAPEVEEDVQDTGTSAFSLVMMALMLLFTVGFITVKYTGFDPAARVSEATPITFNQETGRQGGRSYPAPVALAGLTPPLPRSGQDTTSNRNNYPASSPSGVYRRYLPPGYGRYESCQGRDAQGNRPCKRNRRWYIVNEARNIHHQINFTETTHKDIYAIRPFRDGLAQVFFYDGRQMYLEFCVGLDDRVVECVLRP